MLPKRLSRHRNPSAQWLSLPQQISLRRRNHTTARAIHRVGKTSSVLGSPKSHGTGLRSGWDPRSVAQERILGTALEICLGSFAGAVSCGDACSPLSKAFTLAVRIGRDGSRGGLVASSHCTDSKKYPKLSRGSIASVRKWDHA